MYVQTVRTLNYILTVQFISSRLRNEIARLMTAHTVFMYEQMAFNITDIQDHSG